MKLTVNTVRVTALADSVSCFRSIDGVINASASGGLAPYAFSLYKGIVNTGIAFIGGKFSGLDTSTTYTVHVTDAFTCSGISSVIKVYEPVKLTLGTIDTDSLTCNGLY